MNVTKKVTRKRNILLILFVAVGCLCFMSSKAEKHNPQDELALETLIEQHPEATKKPDVIWKNGYLVRLYWDSAGLTGELDVSAFRHLTWLYCPNNELTELNIQSLNNLEFIYCHNNKLFSLEASSLPNLKELYCSDNQLTQLKLTNLPKIELLACEGNELTSLNVNKLTSLRILSCENNQLTNLSLNKLPKLAYVYCNNNQLTKLNLTSLPKLDMIECFNNKLVSLNLAGASNLKALDCHNNDLTSINVSNNKKLLVITCHNNKLTSLNLKNNKKLFSIICSSNKLTSLNIGSTKIYTLFCDFNNIKSLNLKQALSSTSRYADINVVGNPLKTLNTKISKGKAHILSDSTTKVSKKKTDYSYKAKVIQSIPKSITVKQGTYIIFNPSLLKKQNYYSGTIRTSNDNVILPNSKYGYMLGSAIYAYEKGTTTITVTCNDGSEKSFELIIE